MALGLGLFSYQIYFLRLFCFAFWIRGDVNRFDADDSASNGCEAGCPKVPRTECRNCSSPTTCTVIGTCEVGGNGCTKNPCSRASENEL